MKSFFLFDKEGLFPVKKVFKAFENYNKRTNWGKIYIKMGKQQNQILKLKNLKTLIFFKVKKSCIWFAHYIFAQFSSTVQFTFFRLYVFNFFLAQIFF